MSSYPYDVEFETVKEGWNEYTLSDGARMRIRLTLGKITTAPGVPPERAMDYAFEAQTMIVVYVPQDMKGTPGGKVLTPQQIQASVEEDLEFEEAKVTTNEYLLLNGVRIKMRVMLTRVGKTKYFNVDGAPIYAVNHQMVPQIKFPKNFSKATVQRQTGKTPIV